MAALLNAESQDDLALLFAEDENDEEFLLKDTKGDAGDVNMSSSDSEDEAADDELEGERELQKHAKEESRKKRKKQDPFSLNVLRKRIRTEPNSTEDKPSAADASLPAPKKRPERVSFIPPAVDTPVRSSSRRLTLANKELTHARLKDNEEKRVKLVATLEKAAQRKDKSKEKVMTQADRLAEAERVEKLNSKSLNRWEETERKRTEEQEARLLALQNRCLDGAVLTYWSGKAIWNDGKLIQFGRAAVKQKNERPSSEHKKKNDKHKFMGKNTGMHVYMDDPVAPDNIQVLIPRSKSVADIDAPVQPLATQRSKTDTEVPALQSSPAQDLLAAFQQRTPDPSKETMGPEHGSLRTIELPTRPITPVSNKPLQSQLPHLPGQGPDGFQGSYNHTQVSVPLQSRSFAESCNEKLESPITGVSQSGPLDPPGQTPHIENRPPMITVSTLPSVAAHSRRHTPITPVVFPAERESFRPCVANVPVAHDGVDEPKKSMAIEAVSLPAQDQPLSATTVASVESVPSNAQFIEASVDRNPSQSSQAEPLTTAPPTTTPTITATQAQSSYLAIPSSAAHSRPALQEQGASQEARNATKSPPQLQPPSPHITETTSRNALILTDYEDLSPEQRSEFHTLIPPIITGAPRKASKTSTKPKLPTIPLCPITSRPAKYRDPKTNLPYASAMAYNALNDTIRGRFHWVASRGFECFCGPTEYAAKGVPRRFIDENAANESEDEDVAMKEVHDEKDIAQAGTEQVKT